MGFLTIPFLKSIFHFQDARYHLLALPQLAPVSKSHKSNLLPILRLPSGSSDRHQHPAQTPALVCCGYRADSTPAVLRTSLTDNDNSSRMITPVSIDGRASARWLIREDGSFGLDGEVQGIDRFLDTLGESIDEGNQHEMFVHFFTSFALY